MEERFSDLNRFKADTISLYETYRTFTTQGPSHNAEVSVKNQCPHKNKSFYSSQASETTVPGFQAKYAER